MLWLRKSAASEPLAAAMAGVKLADRVLVIGCSDPPLIASLALKAGLTGRACAVDTAADRVAAAARAVEREGALVETATTPLTTLPFDASAFDIVVARNALGAASRDERRSILAEIQRVLRPGGRLIAIDKVASGLTSLLGGAHSSTPDDEYHARDGAAQSLQATGFVAARILAERRGLRFLEGVKRNA
jgi:ubiquinone/menaquinone biosynthesis C-methylase UbiE